MAGDSWSRLEVEACVADYLRMLTLELNGQHYSKAEHVRALIPKLDDRSKQSIEFKHANISAIMIALGYPYIDGYKPRGNYQVLLFDVTAEQAERSMPLQAAAAAAVERPAAEAAIADPSTIWVPAPKPTRVREDRPAYAPPFRAGKRDYLAQEARNRSLGYAGELFVMELEARRLLSAGKKALSERIEHVASTQGDGLGFDVLSFEDDGRERLIEVKTTAFGELTPFYVSRNELERSRIDAERYRLYRIFAFRERPRVFDLPGAISQNCMLDAVSYLATPGESSSP